MIEIVRRTLIALSFLITCTLIAQEAAQDVVVQSDSRETRQELHELLQRLPPEVGKVLKLDPTLWSNQSYLANYPSLAAFAAAHPEVAHSPGYFLEGIWVQPEPAPRSPATEVWRDTLEMVSILVTIAAVIGSLVWLIKTFVDQRRWTRLSKTQSEVHIKLLDRFASHEDLLAYIQTPAGRRFLESAPIALPATSRPVSSPIARIFWSVQAGLVLVAAGVGLTIISANVHQDVSEPASALGTFVMAIGIGFVISAAASYVLSRRLGLWREPATQTTTE